MGNFVCYKCLGNDYAIRDYIITHGTTEYECDYCFGHSHVIDLDIFGEFLLESILTEYTQAENELGWEDGEYLGSFTWDSVEILEEVNLYILSEQLKYDLDAILQGALWCRKTGYQPTESDYLSESWKQFTLLAKKYKKLADILAYPEYLGDEYSGYNHRPVSEILEDVKYLAEKTNLIVEYWEIGKILRRGRIKPHKLNTASELGSPCSKYAKSNRMSPAGTSMFYGAFDDDTVIAEIVRDDAPNMLSIGIFELVKPIYILDFTQFPEISIFDIQQRQLRESIRFLHDFAKRISDSDAEKHEGYISTQLFVEYIKYHLRIDNNLPIMGIIYNSAQKEKGGKKSFALFLERKHCSSEEEQNEDTYLVLKDVNYYLCPACVRRD